MKTIEQRIIEKYKELVEGIVDTLLNLSKRNYHEVDKVILKINNLECDLAKLEAQLKEQDEPIYHLGCERCIYTFYSKEAFPKPQICDECRKKEQEYKDIYGYPLTKASNQVQEEKPVYDEAYLNDCIKRATPNLSKIKDVDKHLDEIRGIEHKDLPTGWPDLPDND